MAQRYARSWLAIDLLAMWPLGITAAPMSAGYGSPERWALIGENQAYRIVTVTAVEVWMFGARWLFEATDVFKVSWRPSSWSVKGSRRVDSYCSIWMKAILQAVCPAARYIFHRPMPWWCTVLCVGQGQALIANPICNMTIHRKSVGVLAVYSSLNSLVGKLHKTS